MKQKLLLGLAALVLASSTWGADKIWVNASDTIVPSAGNSNAPVIDAVSFLNPVNRTFSINGSYISAYYGDSLYGFTDCLNITNKGYMHGNPGFDFENITVNPQTQEVHYQPAAWFVNQASGFDGGSIDVSGSFFSIPLEVLVGVALIPADNGKLLIRATNIVNSGTISLGDSSLLEMAGDYLDMTGGTLSMSSQGVSLDGYWGVGPLQYHGGVPFQQYGGNGIPFSSPLHEVTNRTYLRLLQSLPMFGAVAYTNQFTNDITVNSNMLTQIVFLRNNIAGFTNLVFFNPDSIQVEWDYVTTNYPYINEWRTNHLLLTDTFGERTNLQQLPNGTTFGARPTYKPVNYDFTQAQVTDVPPAFAMTNGSPLLTNFLSFGLPRNNQTNPYSAYQAIFAPGVSLASDVFGGDVTNIAGRIEVVANSALNLSNAQITSFNYLKISSPGHFMGNGGSQIVAPHTDLDLNSTNGLLTVSGLVAPFAQYPQGVINCYSSRFTNDQFRVDMDTNVVMVTNAFHILFVDSEIQPLTTPTLESVRLRGNNVVLSDVLNVTRTLTVNAQSLTLTTNAGNPFVPEGQININSSQIFWPNATPGLQFMTNWGQISSSNAIFFGGSRVQPAFDPSTIDIPYQAFVNHGMVSNTATYVWSKYFENSGTITGTGGFDLEAGFSVWLHDDAIYATNGDVTLTASDLVLTNTSLFSGGAITLAVTNYLDDGSYLGNSSVGVMSNTWVAVDGLNLPVLPPYSSLLATRVIAANFTRSQQNILWAAKDLGANVSGFYNNAALGGLSLYGSDPTSLFAFLPTVGNNAIYIETLDLSGEAANMDANGKLLNIVIPPGMKVYCGKVTMDGIFTGTGIDISSIINATNNPSLVLVPDILTATPPANPAAVYPALVLDYTQPTIPVQGGGSGSGSPPTAHGPNKLDLPGETRAAGPSGNFIAASYSGLFADTNGISYNSSGYFTVRTTPQGRFTGKVTLRGTSYSFTGKLTSATDTASVSIPQAGLTLNFWLSSSDASQLNGQILGNGWAADLVAFRQANQKSVPAACTLRGTYTLLIPGTTNGPVGTGFGTVKADAGGNVRWAGTLADGSKVTQGSFFSSSGSWGLYASLYGGHGSALGWLQLSSGNGTNLSGQCLWVKPKGLGSRYYVNGFTNDVEAIGSSYVRPRSGSVLSLNSGAGILSFSGAGLTSAASADVELNAHNKVTSTSNLAPTVKINPSSGLFSGSVFLPGLGGKVSFQGALFQNGNFGAGNFLGSTQSGNVSLTPAP